MEKSSTKIEGSPPSSDKRKAEDELETVNPRKRHNLEEVSSIKVDVTSFKLEMDSLKAYVDSVKEDVSSLRATLNSVKSTLDSLPTKDDLLAVVTSIKGPAKKPPKIPASSSDDQKNCDEGEERVLKKAKADTSSNVSSKVSDVAEKETLKQTLRPCSSDDNRLEKTAQGPAKKPPKIPASVKTNVIPVTQNSSSSDDQKKGDEGEEPAQRKAKADTNTLKKESNSNVSSNESDVVEKETLTQTFRTFSSDNRHEKNAQVGERVLFIPQKESDSNFRGYGGTIFVKGYDSSLGEDDIANALLEHFSPCGMVRRIYFKTYDNGAPILRYVFIEMIQGREEALKLNGSDMGGCTLEVHNAKRREEYYINREASGGGCNHNSRHERFNKRNFTRDTPPPLYGIVSSRKINK